MNSAHFCKPIFPRQVISGGSFDVACGCCRRGYPEEVGALFTTVSSIRVSRVRVTLTVTVRVSRVSVIVSVRDSVK